MLYGREVRFRVHVALNGSGGARRPVALLLDVARYAGAANAAVLRPSLRSDRESLGVASLGVASPHDPVRLRSNRRALLATPKAQWPLARPLGVMVEVARIELASGNPLQSGLHA